MTTTLVQLNTKVHADQFTGVLIAGTTTFNSNIILAKNSQINNGIF